MPCGIIMQTNLFDKHITGLFHTKTFQTLKTLQLKETTFAVDGQKLHVQKTPFLGTIFTLTIGDRTEMMQFTCKNPKMTVKYFCSSQVLLTESCLPALQESPVLYFGISRELRELNPKMDMSPWKKLLRIKKNMKTFSHKINWKHSESCY